MALTININTNDAIINVNSSNSDNVISKHKPSKIENNRNELDSISFLLTEKDIEDACCDHRTNGTFDVSIADPEHIDLFRCNKCHEIIDFKQKGDPELIKKMLENMWDTFQVLKTNNNGILSKELITAMATSLLILKKFMPKMVRVVNNRTEKKIEQWKENFPWGTLPNVPSYPPPPDIPPYSPPPFTNQGFTDGDTTHKDKDEKKPPAKPKK